MKDKTNAPKPVPVTEAAAVTFDAGIVETHLRLAREADAAACARIEARHARGVFVVNMCAAIALLFFGWVCLKAVQSFEDQGA